MLINLQIALATYSSHTYTHRKLNMPKKKHAKQIIKYMNLDRMNIMIKSKCFPITGDRKQFLIWTCV